MALVVISPIIELLIGKLGSEIQEEVGLLLGVNDDIQRLHRLLLAISTVLDEAERRSIRDGALRNWLRDLKDAAFDVDDVVDEFQTEILRCKRIKLRDFFFFFHNSIAFRFKMSRKIKHVTRRLDEIVQEKGRFHLVERLRSERRRTDRETYSFVVESKVYGRNGDKEKVINFLTDPEYDHDVSILPIVGLGGVGKTTLVQLVYNDGRVKEHFELQMWVCVSEIFDVKHIAIAIAQSATNTRFKLVDFESIQQYLRQQLGDKRFLLVLDDVWNESTMEWKRLEPLLAAGRRGSKIIVTTRSEISARIMGTVANPHRLDVLSVDDCWALFRQMAFGPGREEETPNLIRIGKDIVSKCGGLPLAAKALGSLMASRRGESEWLAVQNSEIWKLPEGENEILPSLRLSYDHLPPRLKQCFAYCSLFPKDYEINRLKLVQLWIAEGFFRVSDDETCAEDIGNQYFNCLLWRSFFQDEKRDDFGNIVSCKMHDLVHDLACSVARDESSTIEFRRERRVFDGCRYSSITCDDAFHSLILDVSGEAKKLRSLLLFAGSQSLTQHAILNLSNLRALNLSGTQSEKVLNALCKLKHLRFLDLSRSFVRALPNSMTTLYNLQTLNLQRCSELQILPKGMKNLSNLRHLDISGCDKLICMPRGLGKLCKLQTLPLFVVDDTAGSSIVELKDLNLIKGELKIKCLRNIKNPADAMEAKIWAKTNLQSLELYWNRDAGDTDLPSQASENNFDEDVLENFRPHTNLKHFRIEGYDGDKFPCWLTNTATLSLFSNLEKLLIYNLKRCRCLPPLGQLPRLKHLDVRFMNMTERIGREFYGDSGTFSSLEYLMLCRLPNLEIWSIPKREMFPSLKVLIIEWCPKLRIEPQLPSSIVELKLSSKSNEELLSERGCLQGLSRLRLLCIVDIKLSHSQWKGLKYLPALEVLKIGYCEDLTHLPNGITNLHLPLLHTLELVNNYNLTSLGEGRGGEGAQPPRSFTTLRHLIIRGCRALTSLPEWMVGLTSLQSLKISRCHKLESLPDGFQQLTTLQNLTIDCCHILETRCENESGGDWHKVAHIPNIYINK